MLAGELDGAPGVDEPGEGLNQDRRIEGRQVVGQLVELVGIEHRGPPVKESKG
jgi:hypothetical protein